MSCRGEDLRFEVHFSAASTTVWWVLLGAATAVWFLHRHAKSKSMVLYKLLYSVIVLNVISETISLGWITAYSNKHSHPGLSYLYIFFSKLALSSFVGLMLVGAAGFCITRDDLGPHAGKVVGVPIVWLVTGWVTGYIWNYTQGLPDDWCTVSIHQMNDWQSGVWFVCSIINLTTYLMAWIYIFSIMGEELEVIEATERALAQLRQTTGGPAPALGNSTTDRIVKSLLLPEGGRSHLREDVERQPVEVDAETAAQLDTFAGRIDFELKKKLLYRFALGCGAYLTALICVLLLPLFSTGMLDDTLWALESLVKWGFIAALIWIFRPTVQNPYLSLDLQENADLTTELSMLDDDDDPTQPPPSVLPTSTGASAGPSSAAKPSRLSAPSDTANGRDQGPSSGARSATPSTTAREEHNKKFSLGDDEEESMEDIKLQASEDKV